MNDCQFSYITNMEKPKKKKEKPGSDIRPSCDISLLTKVFLLLFSVMGKKIHTLIKRVTYLLLGTR